VLDPKGLHSDYPSHPLAQLERLLSTERGLDFLATASLVFTPEVRDSLLPMRRRMLTYLLQQREELAAALVLMFGHTQADAAFLHWTIAKELNESGAAVNFLYDTIMGTNRGSTANEEKLFKSGEFASLVCKTYARYHCVQYLSGTLLVHR
jgi:hypothetical protein